MQHLGCAYLGTSWDHVEDVDHPAACLEVLVEDLPSQEDHLHREVLAEEPPFLEDHHREVLEVDHLDGDPSDLLEAEGLTFGSRPETLGREDRLAVLVHATQASQDHLVDQDLWDAYPEAHQAHQAEAPVDWQLLLAAVVVAVVERLPVLVVVQEAVALEAEVAVVAAAVVVAQLASVVVAAEVP